MRKVMNCMAIRYVLWRASHLRALIGMRGSRATLLHLYSTVEASLQHSCSIHIPVKREPSIAKKNSKRFGSQRKTAKDLEFSIKIRIFAPNNYYKMKMQMNKLATLLCCLCMAASLQAQVLPYQDANLTAVQRADDLLGRLTLEEKVSLMMDTSPAIERLGIPQFQWWNEALHGIGRNGFATVFPITMGMAASWDDALLHKVFTAVSDEARVKAQQAKRSGDIKRYQSLDTEHQYFP